MHKITIYTLVFIVVSNFSFSQNNTIETKEKINLHFKNYFSLDRESIHLHINKTDFLTSEKVWFKGYVINRKTNAPSIKTTNVYSILFDDKGTKIAQKLLFANNGNFAGNFEISENFSSGEYYIQTYTNWMNNFSEDESSIRKINIINPNQGKVKLNTNNNSIEVTFHPEGTSFIKDASNNVGVKIRDCTGNLVKNIEAEIIASNGEIIKTVKINQFGCGKFEITPTSDNYKFTFTLEGKKTEAYLPKPVETGFALEVNNYGFTDKTIIKLKTNTKTIDSYKNKQLFVVINQDEKIIIHDFELEPNKLNYENVFSNQYLFNGINCIRIVDNNLNLLAERIIYQHPETQFQSDLRLNVNKNNVLNLVGYSNYSDGNISISILPEETKSLNLSQSILYDFTCHPYITESISNFNYFLTETTRAKLFELDLLLITQKTNKYNWDSILNHPPIEKFSFDMGLKIKGNINTELDDVTKYKAKIFSITDGILLTNDINEKKEFEFDHLILAQGSTISLLLLKMPGLNPIESSIVAQIISKNKPFIKGLTLPQTFCSVEKEIIPITLEEFPTIKANVIQLKEVKIDKNELKHKNVFGNRNLRSFKIDESFGNQSLLFFIGSSGFNVIRGINGDVTIASRKNATIKGGTESPAIFIDGIQLYENNELSMYNMQDIDEIYLSNSYFQGGNGTYGIIKIYLKKKKNYYIKNTTSRLTIENGGYEKFDSFENKNYQDFDSIGFKNYGVINFIQYSLMEDNGTYYIQTPNSYKGIMKFIIEGITNDGKLIYEEKLFQVK